MPREPKKGGSDGDMTIISQDMVRALLENPSEENRERSVLQLTEMFRARSAHGRAATMLEEIIRIFAHDAAVRVRKAVAEQLQHDPDLPRDVALSLAHDIDDVAIPILRFSRALSDDDLAAIVAKEGQKKLHAIAGREQIGEKLSDALIDHGDAVTVGTLFANAGSSPTEAGMLKAVERFGDDDRVQTPLSKRVSLPTSVMASMIAVVSDHVLKELSARKDLPLDLAADIVKQAEERVFVGLSRETDNPGQLANELADMGRLTPNLAMRALVGGDIAFFEHAVARMANMKINAVQALAYDSGSLGVSELCKKMAAPEPLYKVFKTGIATYGGIKAEGGAFDRDRFQSRMMERFLSDFESLGDHIPADDVDALVDRLRAAG